MNTGPVRILYMEDDAGMARLMQKRLTSLGYQVSIASDGQKGLEMYAAGEYDLLAIDYNLPVYDGMQVLKRLATEGPLPPCIIITGTGSESLAVEALKIGARDYLVKDLDASYLDLLPTVIERALQQYRLEKEKIAADKALRLAHEHLQATMDALPDLLFEVDRSGVIHNFHAPHLELLYAPPEQFLGKPMGQVLPEDAMSVIQTAIAQSVNGPQHGVVYFLTLPDGLHWFELSVAAKGDPYAKDAHFLLLVRDITDRKRAQEAEHAQRILAEALRDTAAALNSTLDLEQVLDAILTNVSHVETHDYAYIMLLDDQGMTRVVRQAGITSNDQAEMLRALKVDPTQFSIMRQMIESGHPAIVSNTERSPLHSFYPVHSYAGMPIHVQGQVVGFIHLESKTPNFFTPTDIEPLRTFADQAGIAFTNAHLVSKLRQANKQLKEQINEIQALQKDLRQEMINSERLLLNILPAPIASRLKQGEKIIADDYSEATVLFADIVNFTAITAQMAPARMLEMLNAIFLMCDQLAKKYGLEKIKTIGDAYMVVGGLPQPRPDHTNAVADMALEMQSEIKTFKGDSSQPLNLRIGIATGPVVAGVIGSAKFSYDVWGITVNTASRMEAQGIAGRIHVTANVYERLRDTYQFEERGVIRVKNIGEMMTYFLVGRKTS